MMHPCVVHADFETFSTSGSDRILNKQTNLASHAYHTVTRGWEVSACHQYHLKREIDGDLCVDFLQSLLKLHAEYSTQGAKKKMIMTEDDERRHGQALRCMFCKKAFRKKSCRHHDHVTGKYVGAACSECNLAVRHPTDIPVVFHNGRNYDFNFIIQGIKKLQHMNPNQWISYNPFQAR